VVLVSEQNKELADGRGVFYRQRVNLSKGDWVDVYGPLVERDDRFVRLIKKLPRVRNWWWWLRRVSGFRRLSAHLAAEIIHAHSPVSSARLARAVARRLGLPWVYEIRGLWEETAVVEGKFDASSSEYLERRELETMLAKRAEAVVVISEALKKEFLQRGVDERKLWVVPNAVDEELISPHASLVKRLRAEYGLEGKMVIGYAGTVRRLEGLKLVLTALPELLGTFAGLKFMVVGSGKWLSELRALSRKLHLGDAVVFTGAVPPKVVSSYMQLFDVLVLPRIPARVCELVTPLKPLEAMFLGRAVLASDVGGLRELITDGQTGLLFRAGDRQSFISQLALLLREQGLRKKLGANASRWVRANRLWRKVVTVYLRLYQELADTDAARRRSK
jgi:glycosyltransferase involved in cell wall biosynthesis